MNGGIQSLVTGLEANPAKSALLCDLDGTLAPIVDRPDDAEVPAEVAAILAELAERLALVAVITGRPAGLARELVGAETLTYVGNHGLETLEPGDSEPRTHPKLHGNERIAWDLVSEHAQRLARSGVTIEDKGPIVALHWRTAPDKDTAGREATRVAEAARGAGLEPRPGRLVMEIRPGIPVDKGTATTALLDRHREVRVACYAGDDLTDLDAFAALDRRVANGDLDAGWRVAVLSPEAPDGLERSADVTVDDTGGFLDLLSALRS